MNVTLGARDAKRNVTDMASQVRGEWRHADARLCVDMASLS